MHIDAGTEWDIKYSCYRDCDLMDVNISMMTK